MPPAFLVDKFMISNMRDEFSEIESKGYTVKGVVSKFELTAKINWGLHKDVTSQWKKLQPKDSNNYIKWDVRYAITSKAARENDRKLKVEKWTAFRNELVSLFGNKWQTEATNHAHNWVKNARANLKYDDWTHTYVKAHQESHPVRGMSWGQLLLYKEMNKFFRFTKEFVSWWDDEFLTPGDWSLSQETTNYGIRARSPDDMKFRVYQEPTLTRARQIGFCPGVSSVNAFVRHNKSLSYMRKVFNEYESILGCRIISPKTEGGIIYTILRDEFLNGSSLNNYDVSGMELITPSLLNGQIGKMNAGLGAVVGYMQDIPELLSGVAPTSDWDMIAHLELLTKIIKKTPTIIVILGDDGTIVNGSVDNTILYERQYKDERIHRTLGLVTTELLHPVGLNITIDSATQQQVVTEGKWVHNRLTPKERSAVAELFTGFVNDVPLHELIGKLEPEPFAYSPKELLQIGLDIPMGA